MIYATLFSRTQTLLRIVILFVFFIATTPFTHAQSTAQTVSLKASDANILINGSTTFTWESTNATYCTNDFGGGTATSGSITKQFGSAGSFTYTITCYGSSGLSASAQTTVAVNGSASASTVTTKLSTDKTEVGFNTDVTLSWESTNATYCTNDFGGASATSGTLTKQFSSAGTFTYTITCYGTGGSLAKAQQIIKVNSALSNVAPTVTLNASATDIYTGDTSVLTWEAKNATYCTASGSNWNGTKALTGSETLSFYSIGTNTYSIVCYGQNGSSVTAQASVKVSNALANVVSTTLTTDQKTISINTDTTISWDAKNATYCLASWDTSLRAISGTITKQFASAGTYTYSLTCYGAGGNATISKIIQVSPDSTSSTSLSSTNLSIGKSSAVVGDTATISWDAKNATYCSASGNNWNGLKAISGTETLTFYSAGTLTYTLTCFDTKGYSVVGQEVVKISPASSSDILVSLTVTPDKVTMNTDTVIAWEAKNATFCSNSWDTSASVTGTLTKQFSSAGTYIYSIVCFGTDNKRSSANTSIYVNGEKDAGVVSLTLKNAPDTGDAKSISVSSATKKTETQTAAPTSATTSSSQKTNNNSLSNVSLTKNLKLGMNDGEVKILQLFLNSKGFIIASSGPGSIGNESTYFGKATRNALIKYQEARVKEILEPAGITKGTGSVYSMTRAQINKEIGS